MAGYQAVRGGRITEPRAKVNGRIKPPKPKTKVSPTSMQAEAMNRMDNGKPKPTKPPLLSATGRQYAPGTQVNRTKNARAGMKYRTYTENGQVFHEYRIKGKRVVVKGNNNPSRKLK